MKYVITAAAAAILILAAVLIIRALRFKPQWRTGATPSQVFVDGTAAAQTLAELIKCRTVSSQDAENEDKAEFDKFKAKLPSLFPSVFNACESIEIGDKSILIRWHGKKHDSPVVFMAHYDVVSVSAEKWQKPAFEGIIENGVIWGRGVIDTKGTLNAVMSAAEMLISTGFVPENDIFMAFAGDEEVGGHGAIDIVSYFKEKEIKPLFVLDEGGAVVENIFPGVKQPAALIGIAEKGMVNIEYSVSGGGGHASTPERCTPIGRLARACARIEYKDPFKFRITDPTAKMFDILARYSTFGYRLIFANLWLFSPLLSLYTRKSGGELNALVRTTSAFTQMQGSRGMNVIPPYAAMLSNHRIIPGETTESVISRIKETVNDDKITIRGLNGMDPSRVSVTSGNGWDAITESVTEAWQDAIVSPYLMFACSDSRHWDEISDRVYRFSPMALSKEERGYIHGNDERLPISTVAKAVEFYIRLIKKI